MGQLHARALPITKKSIEEQHFDVNHRRWVTLPGTAEGLQSRTPLDGDVSASACALNVGPF
jgi:hypothetical protein